MRNKINILIVVLALALAGILLYQYWWLPRQAQSVSPEQLIGGQRDEHGCLIPAGYSWCELKQKCLRTWEESCEQSRSTAMDKIIIAQLIILAAGTIFAWFNFGREFKAWRRKTCPAGCGSCTNPLLSPCLYGALFFTAALVLSWLIFSAR
jgi:hypothetical protein